MSKHCGAWKEATHKDRGSIDCGCGWGAYCPFSDRYEPPTPEDEDDYISDATHGYSVMRGGKFLGCYPTERRAAAALYLARNRESYWPNVWRVNDHGNMTLLEFSGHRLQATEIGYV